MQNANFSPERLTEVAGAVDALNRQARKERTPCGDGTMVWRIWGSGERLVLFHGGSGSWTHWIRNIPVLSERYEVWVPDIPGLGDSAMPPEPRTPSTIADVVAAGLESLFPPDETLRLTGFSFGGHVAGLVAKRLNHRMRELTLIGVAGLGLPAEPREPFWKERSGMSLAERMAVYHQNLAVLMFADPAKIDALAVYLQWQNVERARFRSRPFAPTDELAKALADVTAPLKTIWGTEDAIARSSLNTRLDILRQHHPELQVRLIEGAGHWVMYEAADEFNAAFLDLLGAE